MITKIKPFLEQPQEIHESVKLHMQAINEITNECLLNQNLTDHPRTERLNKKKNGRSAIQAGRG